jgi:hypothetical protein
MTTALAAVLAAAPVAQGQAPGSPPASADQNQAQYSPAQLDQMLAPIALYPDDLLGQVLMAATYPVEVVQADRWLQDPANAALSGDDLAAAMDQQSWDPSVKSLVAFPHVLSMMDGELDWTESLGEAFMADQSAVMDSVQRLRRQAEAAGKLRSNGQQVVTDQDGVITIQSASPQTIYVPDYEPDVVYGPWPYPDWPPYYFPTYFDECVYDDFGYCWFGVPIIIPLWGWDHWDWRNHRIDIDRGRFGAENHGRPPIGGGAWEHDPSHRLGVPYQQSSIRERFQGAATSSQTLRDRGYPSGAAAQVAPQITHAPPIFQSYGGGEATRVQAERGQSSRGSAPSYSPRSSGGSSAGTRSSGGGRR